MPVDGYMYFSVPEPFLTLCISPTNVAAGKITPVPTDPAIIAHAVVRKVAAVA